MSTMILRMPPLRPGTTPPLHLSSLVTSRDGISQLPVRLIITPFRPTPTFPTIIRNGGGPRTFPGGVSKWQWKRMQAKKQKQLLKARLCRERQIYEMRKRAELRAAVSELERPWEVVERAPALFSVSADEQLKTLADRFQRPGGYDLWSERDGPQLFDTADGLPSARFLPKDAVHSVKPYGVRGSEEDLRDENEGRLYNGNKRKVRKNASNRRGVSGGVDGEAFPKINHKKVEGGLNNLRISSMDGSNRQEGLTGVDGEGFPRNDYEETESGFNNLRISRGKNGSNRPGRSSRINSEAFPRNGYKELESGLSNLRISSRREERGSERNDVNGRSRGGTRNKGVRGVRRNVESVNSYGLDSKETSYDFQKRGRGPLPYNSRIRGNVCRKSSGRDQSNPNDSHIREVYDMSLKQDGSYELQASQHESMLLSGGLEDEFELN